MHVIYSHVSPLYIIIMYCTVLQGYEWKFYQQGVGLVEYDVSMRCHLLCSLMCHTTLYLHYNICYTVLHTSSLFCQVYFTFLCNICRLFTLQKHRHPDGNADVDTDRYTETNMYSLFCCDWCRTYTNTSASFFRCFLLLLMPESGCGDREQATSKPPCPL